MGYELNSWMLLPFGLLLTIIALGPLWFPTWWFKHYAKVALVLGSITLAYYLFALPHAALERVHETGHDYFGFIALVGSLFIVSGGIHINVKGEATPFANVMFLLVGALISNFLGTTGASMLLIRPWLRMNKFRITSYHVVFFIFIVSNVGGCLTPIGDPPLFLGYLRGIPFWWVLEHCWSIWLLGVAFLLAVFYVIDRRNYARSPQKVRELLAEPADQWRFEGLWNLFFLAVILGAVFISNPPYLREGLMIAAAAASYFTTPKAVHKANHFNFHPIKEVAILFIGIFATMMPALDWLHGNAHKIVGDEPSAALFFWGSGTLSSFLDNAPTYLGFLKALGSIFVNPDTVAQVQQFISSGTDWTTSSESIRHTMEALQKYFPAALAGKHVVEDQIQVAYLLGNPQLNLYLVAISIGSVFFGACTYIGNGPNFMVKSIAHHQKVHTPTFLGYLFNYTVPVMLPLLIIVWLVFFRS